MNNFLHNNYILEFSKIPEVVYHTVNTQIPSISLLTTEVVNPIVNYMIPDPKMEYGTWSMDFIVDENLKNYLEIYSWMNLMGGNPTWWNPEAQKKQCDRSLISTASITIFNGRGEESLFVDFTHVFPKELSEIELTPSDEEKTVCTVEFSYAYFRLRLPGGSPF